jgi:hypothetical protein
VLNNDSPAKVPKQRETTREATEIEEKGLEEKEVILYIVLSTIDNILTRLQLSIERGEALG